MYISECHFGSSGGNAAVYTLVMARHLKGVLAVFAFTLLWLRIGAGATEEQCWTLALAEKENHTSHAQDRYSHAATHLAIHQEELERPLDADRRYGYIDMDRGNNMLAGSQPSAPQC